MPNQINDRPNPQPLGGPSAVAPAFRRQFLVRWYPLLIPASVLLFYLPFIPRAFMGDDWLWLAHAKKALADPSLLLSRPIYGYFRPLFMAYIGVLQATFGLNAFAFALANLGFHIANCYLLIRLLARLGMTHGMIALAAVFFGFYFLTCPAVCWISAGADLLTLTLIFLFCLLTVDYYERASAGRLVLIVVTGLAAVLVKEVGFVSVLIFFLYPLLQKKNPLRSGYTTGGVVMLVVYAAYLVLYFKTRSFIDKELVTDADLIVNLWFLCTYQLLPVSQRMVATLGDNLRDAWQLVRAAITLGLPFIWAWLFIKRDASVRLFLFWPLLFLGPVALFDWNVGLFDLYPERTASRYMYTAVPGTAVFVAVILAYIYQRLRLSKVIAALAPVLFLAGNAAAVYSVTRTYQARQQESTNLYDQLLRETDGWSACDTLEIRCELAESRPKLLAYPRVLESICFLIAGQSITVLAIGPGLPGETGTASDNCVLTWQASKDARGFELAPKSGP